MVENRTLHQVRSRDWIRKNTFTNIGIDNEPLLMVAWNKRSRSLPVVILMASSIWIRCWWCFCIIIHFNSSLFFNFFLLAPFCSPVLKPNLYSCLRQVNSLDEVFKTGKNSISRLTELSTRSRTIMACARNWVLVLQSLRLPPAVLPILVQYFVLLVLKTSLSKVFSGINVWIMRFLKYSFELAKLGWSERRSDEN